LQLSQQRSQGAPNSTRPKLVTPRFYIVVSFQRISGFCPEKTGNLDTYTRSEFKKKDCNLLHYGRVGEEDMDEFIYASATELARAIRAKEVSSEEVVDACLERIEKVNPKLNAVVQLTADAARAQAREADAALAQAHIKGPLHGVPITIKDNIDTAGVICTGGTKGRASFVPTQDATVVARVRAAGAIMLGKTNLPELALAFETNNLVYGRTNNPYDLSRTPGGSSGGEAAIIGTGGSPLGLGNDYGGSVRVPCHFCGIAGLKPTAGRVSRAGVLPWSHVPGRDMLLHVGPMARFVEDLILTLPVIAGVDWRDPSTVPMPLGDPKKVDLKSLRVAFYTDNGIVSPTSETVKVVQRAAKVLSDAGMIVEEGCPEGIGQTFGIWNGLLAGASDGGAGLEKLLQMTGTVEMHPWMHRVLESCRRGAITTSQLNGLMLQWGKFCCSMLSFMEKHDVIICPVCAFPASLHGGSFDRDGSILPAFSYTMTYNLTGWPAVVVRGGTSPEGLPIGVQVVARPWRDDVAMAVAQHIETASRGWRRPPL
jgi:amidase